MGGHGSSRWKGHTRGTLITECWGHLTLSKAVRQALSTPDKFTLRGGMLSVTIGEPYMDNEDLSIWTKRDAIFSSPRGEVGRTELICKLGPHPDRTQWWT